MIDLDFLSYADVHRVILETIPVLRQFPVESVTYVPRGGALIAGIVAQILDLPLIGSEDLPHPDRPRCLLVDDMIVTGRSLARFRHQFLPNHRAVPTYVFASVPQERPPDTEVDVVSIVVDPERYFLLPWEIGDIFRPIFPFPILVELDGVIRSAVPPFRPILSTPHPIAHLVSFGTDRANDDQWLTRHGYRYRRLTALPDPADLEPLAEIIQRDQVRLYLGAEPARAIELKRRCPTCHVLLFPTMTEVLKG